MLIKEYYPECEDERFKLFFISCPKGHISGKYIIHTNRIMINRAVCDNCLKKLIEVACSHFKTNRILFYEITNPHVYDIIKGFKKVKMHNPNFNDEVECLVGEWTLKESGLILPKINRTRSAANE